MSVVTEIAIQEVTGSLRRRIVLRGHSMPEWGDEMPVIGGRRARGKVVYPPGNPHADIALAGTTWAPTTFSGNWSDRYLYDPKHSATLVGFSGIGASNAAPRNTRDPNVAASPSTGFGGRATTAFQLVRAFQELVGGQQTLHVTIGPITLIGILREFTPRMGAMERWSWEAEFEWASDTLIPPKPRIRPRIEASGMHAFIKAALDTLNTAYNALGVPARIYQNIIRPAFDTTVLAVNEFLDKLQSTITGALAPMSLLDDLRAGLVRIKTEALELARAVSQNLARFKEPLSPRAAAEADLAVLTLSRDAERMAAAAAEREAELAAMQVPDLIAAVWLTDGQDLRSLALQYYGNQADWIRILTYNGFASSNLPPGTLVLIPVKQ